MEPAIPTFITQLWPVIWPFLLLAVVWIVIRFVFRLAMRVMVTGCAVLLLVGAVLFVLRLVR